MLTYYPYLEDKEFLKQLDESNNKRQLIKIQVLQYTTEMPIASLEGISISGTVNLGDSAAVRRTFSGSIAVKPEGIYNEGYNSYIQYGNITEVQNLISLNKKVKIEVGFVNNIDNATYSDYKIIWLPLGIYIIKNASISQNSSGINISLTCSDKAVTLNGEVGGTIPADTVFSEMEIYDSEDNTKRTIEKILIKNIIRSIVVEFGGEKPENVIITDVPDYITKIVKWTGDKPLYYNSNNKVFTLDKEDGFKEYSKGQDIGCQIAPFIYPGTLEAKTGESVASVLNKIKNTLGNFEWFYDVHGRFIFQKKKNYLYDSPTSDIDWLTELNDNSFLSVQNGTKSIYTFEDNTIVTSMSNAPQYSNIKNDFVIWGTVKGATGKEKPIRYHLVFDKKPIPNANRTRSCIVYKDARGLWKVVCGTSKIVTTTSHPIADSDRSKYYIVEEGPDENGQFKYPIYFWDDEYKGFRERPDWEFCKLRTDDWRTELYFLGLEQEGQSLFNNYYAAELNAEWPKIYNVKAIDVSKTDASIKTYKGDYYNIDPSNYEFGIDFLEGDQGAAASVSQFNVGNIGRRTKVVSDKLVNCIYPTPIEDIAIIEADGDVVEERKYAEAMGKQWTQVSPEVNKYISIGGGQSSAYDLSKELLVNHTQYNEAVNISTIPVYYLEPNQRITVRNQDLGINGDYLIKSISLPLTPNGTSTIAATRCIERTI